MARACFTIQAFARIASALTPSAGSVTTTAGVRWPLRVGPPSTRPRMNSASPPTSKGVCSMS